MRETESFTYDGNGNVLTHTDFNGKITSYTVSYDKAGNDELVYRGEQRLRLRGPFARKVGPF